MTAPGDSATADDPPHPVPNDSGVARLINGAGPLLMMIVGGLAVWKAWPMGPDVQVDFGRELYLPWRVSEGDRLYQDIAHFNGPLSVYWNALWFKLIGVGLSTLKLVNLSIAIAIAAWIYRLMSTISSRFAASVVGIFFVGALAFGQSLQLGNYNYLTPYSHELTHGIALSLLGLVYFAGLLKGVDHTRVAMKTGLILGLVLLTKTEVFGAFAVALGTGFALDHWCAGRKFADALPTIKLLLLSFVSLLLVFLIALTLALSLDQGPGVALSGLLEPWRSLTNSSVISLPYYRWVMGTLNLSQSLSLMLQWTLRYAVFFAALAGLSLAWRGASLQRWAPVWGVVFAALVLLFPLDPSSALQVPRPLAFLIPLLFIALLLQLVRRKQRNDPAARLMIVRLTVLAFCAVLQLKMALNTQLNHYGFALVVPSLLVFIVLAMELGAGWVGRHSGSQWVFRLGVAAAVAWVALALVERTEQRFADRTISIGEGADQMLGDSRAQYIKSALAMLEKSDPNATVAVLPEGIMLNYLARRINPTRYINFMPPEVLLYGGDTILAAYRETPPDYVVFVHKNTQLYGFPFFGRHYGRGLYRWVINHYEPVQQLGPLPFQPDVEFGITLFERAAVTTQDGSE